MTKRKIWMAIVVASACVIIAVGAIYFWPYDTRELQGDATIEDTGFWSYPRFHVRFPAVSLSEPGEHVFTVRGLPPVPLSFILNLADLQEKENEARDFLRSHPNSKFAVHQNQNPEQSEAIYEKFRKVDTVVEFTWSCDGEIIVTAIDPLKSWKLEWTPAYQSGGYWHPKGLEVSFGRRNAYQLKLKVRNVDVHAPPLLVAPTLRGGGNELP
jgi:hypothetical protein